MPDRRPTDQGFNDLLEGKLVEASPQLERLRKLANALEPAERPAPSAQFRARLRSELLAAASMSEEDTFAALLDGLPIEAPSEVRSLVAVAAALEPAHLPQPDPAFRFRLRNELLETASGPGTLGARARGRIAAFNDRMRRSLRVVVSAGIAAAVIAGSGATFAAASNALPGDALYPVKLFRESAQLAFSSGPSEGLKRLDFARTRLREIRGLEQRGNRNPALYIATLDRMDVLTQTGTTELIDAVRHGGQRTLLRSVGGFASVQEQDLQALIPAIPPAAVPAARDSLVVLQRVSITVDEVLKGCPCNPPSNPLIPQSAKSTSSSDQTLACSCNTSGPSGSINDGTSQAGGSTQQGTSTTPSTPSSPGTPQTQPTIIDQLPDVPGTNVDNQVKGLVDQLLNQPLPSPLPTVKLPPLQPVPSVPSLP